MQNVYLIIGGLRVTITEIHKCWAEILIQDIILLQRNINEGGVYAVIEFAWKNDSGYLQRRS